MSIIYQRFQQKLKKLFERFVIMKEHEAYDPHIYDNRHTVHTVA